MLCNANSLFLLGTIIEKIRLRAIILFVFSLASIYLFLTRQIIIAVLFSIFLSVFFSKKSKIENLDVMFVSCFVCHLL